MILKISKFENILINPRQILKKRREYGVSYFL